MDKKEIQTVQFDSPVVIDVDKGVAVSEMEGFCFRVLSLVLEHLIPEPNKYSDEKDLKPVYALRMKGAFGSYLAVPKRFLELMASVGFNSEHVALCRSSTVTALASGSSVTSSTSENS